MSGPKDRSAASEQEVLQMLQDTSTLAAKRQCQQLTSAAAAYKASSTLADQVEFWSWMDRNFSGAGGHMFASNMAMKQYIVGGEGKAAWMYKQLQGKGYEWDWMCKQRASVRNVFKTYYAGDVSNQAAIDVTERNLLTGTNKAYQMKAYISRNNPDLHNTGREIPVVTNAEKADVVRRNGYRAEAFKDRQEIMGDVDARLKEIDRGTAMPGYTVENVAGAMVKSGFVGCAFGIGTEAIASYRLWKQGDITDEEYLDEILCAGGEAGTTAAVSTGILVPVSAAVTGAGASTLLTIPVAFAVTAGVDKIVAPCFGRGEYRRILNKARYYRSMEQMYQGFVQSTARAAGEYEQFAAACAAQEQTYQTIRQKDRAVTKALKDLYDSI